jgi:hypothetical protein
VPNREAKSLTKFVRENVAKGAVVGDVPLDVEKREAGVAD